jgi:hypothetical protein
MAIAVGPVAAVACTHPHPPPRSTTTTTGPASTGSTTTTPATGDCRIIDFEKATLVRSAPPAEGAPPRYVLTVSGTKPSISETVRLVAVTYIRQPEYWAIEVTACEPPGAGLPATGPYTVSADVTSTLGTKGVEVVGASRSQQIDLEAPFVGLWAVTGVPGGITGGTVPLVDGSSISLDLAVDHTVSGGSCNTYRARWTAEGSALSITGLTQTTRPCPGPAIPEQEQRYFDGLRHVASYRIDGGRLVLTDAAGLDIITAERRPAP